MPSSPITQKVLLKKCSNPYGCSFHGDDLLPITTEFFHANYDGFKNICKKCSNATDRKRSKKRKAKTRAKIIVMKSSALAIPWPASKVSWDK